MHHGRLDPGVTLLNKPYRKKDLAEKLRQVIDAVLPRRKIFPSENSHHKSTRHHARVLPLGPRREPRPMQAAAVTGKTSCFNREEKCLRLRAPRSRSLRSRRRPSPHGSRAERYPDPFGPDPRSGVQQVPAGASQRRAASHRRRWNEGPVWFGDGRCLLWSDIPNNRIMRWDEETGRVSVFRKPSNNANGNTRDRQGRLVTCEHDTRRVTRTEYDGTITVLIGQVRRQAAQFAERHRGEVRRLDLVHRSAVRHPRQLRGPCGDAGTADQRLSPRSQERPARPVAAGDVIGRTGSPSRRTS